MALKASKAGFWLGAILAALMWTGTARAQVEIEYWQYTFAQRVQAIDELIKRFEAANPGINHPWHRPGGPAGMPRQPICSWPGSSAARR